MKLNKIIYIFPILSLLVIGCDKNNSTSSVPSISNSNVISDSSSNSSSNDISSSISVSTSVTSKYKVSINKSDGFTIDGLNDTYDAGIKVSFSVNVTNENKTIKEVKVNDDILTSNNNTYNFIMPSIDPAFRRIKEKITN